MASHWGGTRNGTIVHWPRGIKAKGEVRTQFSHVIDVAPTILEAAGIPQPTFVNGVQQSPIEGTSMRYSFDDAAAPERHDLQYFEMFCNRGIYHKGWSAVTRHSTPWVVAPLPPFEDDVWELYDGSKRLDAGPRPGQGNARQAARAAAPLADRSDAIQGASAGRPHLRAVQRRPGRPQLIRGDSQLLFGGMGRLTEGSIVVIKNKSFSVTAEVVVSERGAEGVIIAQGGITGGWSLFARGGKAKFTYNFLGLEPEARSQDRIRPASASLRDATARHPSPAFMSEGWWTRFSPDGTH